MVKKVNSAALAAPRARSDALAEFKIWKRPDNVAGCTVVEGQLALVRFEGRLGNSHGKLRRRRVGAFWTVEFFGDWRQRGRLRAICMTIRDARNRRISPDYPMP